MVAMAEIQVGRVSGVLETVLHFGALPVWSINKILLAVSLVEFTTKCVHQRDEW